MSDIAPTRQFPLHAKLTMKRPDREIPLTIAAMLQFDQAVAQWQLDEIDIGGLIGHAPFRLTGNAQMNTAAGTPDASKVHVDFDLATDRFEVPSSKTAVATLGGGSFAAHRVRGADQLHVDPSLDEPLLPLELIGKRRLERQTRDRPTGLRRRDVRRRNDSCRATTPARSTRTIDLSAVFRRHGRQRR